MVSLGKDIKGSVSKSNNDLLPKLHTDVPGSSIRSSRDRDFTKDDSAEIVEYQGMFSNHTMLL